MSPAGAGAEVGVVIATRDRRDSLLRTLGQLAALPEQPPLVVVDNASGDGTAAAVSAAFPQVRLFELERNLGAAARNLGAAQLATPFVAFSDDDSWWRPGALAAAARTLRRHPEVGLLAARILVGAEGRLDPVSALMEGAAAEGLPGPRVSGFLACGAVVRRGPFLRLGGFCERFLIGAEEELLAIDLRRAGWELCYAPEVVAIHCPDGGARRDRGWLARRNALWTAWMRAPAPSALRDTWAATLAACRSRQGSRALLAALRRLPWALAMRRRALPRR